MESTQLFTLALRWSNWNGHPNKPENKGDKREVSMSGIRKRYTEEFKREAVKLASEGGRRVSEVARSLGVERSLLDKWKRGFEAEEKGAGLSGAEQDELERLRRENRQLKMEKEILKKGGSLLRQGVELRYQFIDEEKKAYRICALCRTLEVSRSGYYDWCRRSACPQERLELEIEVKAIHAETRAT